MRSRRVTIALTLVVSGCHSISGLPSLVPLQGGSGPTVHDVVSTVACELASAMVTNIAQPDQTMPDDGSQAVEAAKKTESDLQLLWSNLIKYNYVAVVSLQLEVTNSEGLNPSLNFITPYIPVPTPGVTKSVAGTPFAGNFTLALNGQLDASQDRLFVYTFNIDFARLFNSLKSVEEGKTIITSNTTGKPMIYKKDGKVRLDCQTGSGIYGDLGLDEVLHDGLLATQATELWDVYNIPTAEEAGYGVVVNPAPAESPRPERHTRPDQTYSYNDSPLPEERRPLVPPSRAPNLLPPSGGSPPPSGPPSTVSLNAQSPTSFSSKVAFTITEGINGGPSWTLRHFSGPGGGSGAGGGGKGGSGGSGSSGSGGGASQGLFNLNRVTVDTLNIEVAATCYRPIDTSLYPVTVRATANRSEEENTSPQNYWQAIPKCPSATTAIVNGKGIKRMVNPQAGAVLQQLQLQNLFRLNQPNF